MLTRLTGWEPFRWNQAIPNRFSYAENPRARNLFPRNRSRLFYPETEVKRFVSPY